MRFYVSPDWARSKAKRLKRALGGAGVEMQLTKCQNFIARMYGFRDWNDLLHNWDIVPLSSFDEDSDADVVEARRDQHERVLATCGVDGLRARTVLEATRPTGAPGRSRTQSKREDLMWEGFEDIDY